MYRFDWHGETPPFHKAVHALELPFVFGNFDSLRKALQEPLGDDAEQLSKQIQSAWLAFAKPETRTPLTSIGNMIPIHAKLCFSTRIPLSKVIPIQQNAASCFKHKNAKGAGSLGVSFILLQTSQKIHFRITLICYILTQYVNQTFIKEFYMEKSSIIGTAAVIIGALMTLVSLIFLRDTDFYAVRWIGVVIMVAGFSCGTPFQNIKQT